jgi:hypothetical protein
VKPCSHWIGAEARHCGRHARLYLQGWRCADHTLSAVAGRPEPEALPAGATRRTRPSTRRAVGEGGDGEHAPGTGSRERHPAPVKQERCGRRRKSDAHGKVGAGASCFGGTFKFRKCVPEAGKEFCSYTLTFPRRGGSR